MLSSVKQKKAMPNVFLTAQWRKLLMANYAVDPSLLQPYLPAHTELDYWNGTCYVSLVGFMFMNTKVVGFQVPWHANFEEVNLRFYVKHQTPSGEWRRGVVFIKEIVPRPAIAAIANTLFYEHYVAVPMRHRWHLGETIEVMYAWDTKGQEQRMAVKAPNLPQPLVAGSEGEFITEHYWGYTKVSGTKTTEYQVEHPSWMLYPVQEYDIQVDMGLVYGPQWAFLQREKPLSVFLAEGSEIKVRNKRSI